MILHADVTHYTVGDAEFEKGMTAVIPHLGTMPSQAYNLAYAASIETGLPIVTHGPDSIWNPAEKEWQLRTSPDTLDGLVQNA